MQLIAGEVALSRCDGAYAPAQRFDEVGRTMAERRGFVGDLCFNGLPYENGFGYATTPGQIGETTIEPNRKFAGQYAHAKKGNTPAVFWQYLSCRATTVRARSFRGESFFWILNARDRARCRSGADSINQRLLNPHRRQALVGHIVEYLLKPLRHRVAILLLVCKLPLEIVVSDLALGNGDVRFASRLEK